MLQLKVKVVFSFKNNFMFEFQYLLSLQVFSKF